MAPVGEQLDQKLGLALRFSVTIGGTSLGNWSQCDGLKVKFHTDDWAEGGENNYVSKIAGRLEWETIKLTRAITPDTNKTIAYLREFILTRTPADATITCFTAWGDEAMRWELSACWPISWSGPKLDAKSKDVAMEVLELYHEGFVAPLAI